MPDISIKIRDKIAQTQGSPEIVCGNSDYTAVFDFDSEWDDYESKTARFVWRDLIAGKIMYSDVVFADSIVSVPVVYNTDKILIGVYAGDIRTTTPAAVPCARCIADNQPAHDPPPEDVYEQLLEYLAQLEPSGGGGMGTAGNAALSSAGASQYEAGVAEFLEV